MNKIHKTLFSLFAFFVGHEAHAVSTCESYSGIPPLALIVGTAQHILGDDGCTGTTTSYYRNNSGIEGYIKEINCSGCKDGYKADYKTITVGACNFSVTGCTICTGCTNCTSTAWTTATNGINQSQTTAICTDKCNNVCNKTTSYRCIAGYYGTPENTTTGCYVCPTSGGLTGTSIAISNKTVNSCYIPSGQSFTNTTGTYEFTTSCFYSS